MALGAELSSGTTLGPERKTAALRNSPESPAPGVGGGGITRTILAMIGEQHSNRAGAQAGPRCFLHRKNQRHSIPPGSPRFRSWSRP
jgi:hypothetical protein